MVKQMCEYQRIQIRMKLTPCDPILDPLLFAKTIPIWGWPLGTLESAPRDLDYRTKVWI